MPRITDKKGKTTVYDKIFDAPTKIVENGTAIESLDRDFWNKRIPPQAKQRQEFLVMMVDVHYC